MFWSNAVTSLLALFILCDAAQNQTETEDGVHERIKRKSGTFSSYMTKDNTHIHYHIGGTLTSKTEWTNQILLGLAEWQKLTCLRFTRHYRILNNPGFLKFQNSGGGCYCGGVINLGGPNDPACKFRGTVIHEVGHWIGLAHEQKRPDSRAFVHFNKFAISGDNFAQFQRSNVKHVRTLVPYDMTSIMHYDRNAFRKSIHHSTIEAHDDRMNYAISGNDLTFYDLKLVNMIYKCADRCGLRRLSCENEGYMDKHCRCVCPDYFTSSSNCKSLNVTGCGGIMNVNYGQATTISSPGYPNSYGNRQTCVWVIKSPPRTTLLARFLDFDLEDDPKTKHCEDQLEVRHFGLAHKGLRLCGGNRPKNVESLYNNMMLVFKTDPAVRKRGFRIQLHARTREDCDSSPCYNGGVCRMAELMYFCLCAGGYEGRNCEQRADGKLFYNKETNRSPKCSSGLHELPLGMKSGKIKDSQLRASSYRPECPPGHGRLERYSPAVPGRAPCHAWCPSGHTPDETNFKHWIQVDLLQPRRLTKIVLQPQGGYTGLMNQIHMFKLQFSDNGHVWKTYGGESYELKGFLSYAMNSFWNIQRLTPVTARYVRIRVSGHGTRSQSFYNGVIQPCMRFELYGCMKPGTTEPTPPPLPTLPPIPTTPAPVTTEHLAVGCALQQTPLTCPTGQTLTIKHMGWGRPYVDSLRKKCNLDSRECPFQTVPTRYQSRLKARCNGRQSCSIYAYYTELGDPCPGIGKVLLAVYLCTGPPVVVAPKPKPTEAPVASMKSVTGCAPNRFYPRCPAGQTIRLLKVQWGRPPQGSSLRQQCNLDNRDCPFQQITGAKWQMLQKRCNGKQSCQILAYYIELGDPCEGVGKMAQATFQCLGPATTPQPCRDDHDTEECAYWAKVGECEKNPGWMKKNCRLSCKVCRPVMSDAVYCHDSNQTCAAWAANGECDKNPTYMLVNCRKSCNNCGACADENDQCPGWAKIGECEKNPGYMMSHCERSCGKCSGVPKAMDDPVFSDVKCSDENNNCASWAAVNQCTSNPEFMGLKCQKSCNTCGCSDTDTRCDSLSKAGECARNPWMHINCRKSCRLCCEKEDEDLCCFDLDPRCAKWAQQTNSCQTGDSPIELQENCPYSCGKCTV